MKILFFLAFLFAMNFAQGQEYNREEPSDQVFYGLRVDTDLWIAMWKIPEIIISKNWPLYGYAIPEDSGNYPCNELGDNDRDLPTGKVSVASLETDSSDVSYIGFPIEGTVSTENTTGNSNEYTTFRIADVCDWFSDSQNFENIRNRLQTGWSNDTSSRPWFLLVERPLPTPAADIRVATHPRPRQMAVID